MLFDPSADSLSIRTSTKSLYISFRSVEMAFSNLEKNVTMETASTEMAAQVTAR
jgi:hypothetical protein